MAEPNMIGAPVVVHDADAWQGGAYENLVEVPVVTRGAIKERTGPNTLELVDGRTIGFDATDDLWFDGDAEPPTWRVPGWIIPNTD